MVVHYRLRMNNGHSYSTASETNDHFNTKKTTKTAPKLLDSLRSSVREM